MFSLPNIGDQGNQVSFRPEIDSTPYSNFRMSDHLIVVHTEATLKGGIALLGTLSYLCVRNTRFVDWIFSQDGTPRRQRMRWRAPQAVFTRRRVTFSCTSLVRGRYRFGCGMMIVGKEMFRMGTNTRHWEVIVSMFGLEQRQLGSPRRHSRRTRDGLVAAVDNHYLQYFVSLC